MNIIRFRCEDTVYELDFETGLFRVVEKVNNAWLDNEPHGISPKAVSYPKKGDETAKRLDKLEGKLNKLTNTLERMASTMQVVENKLNDHDWPLYTKKQITEKLNQLGKALDEMHRQLGNLEEADRLTLIDTKKILVEIVEMKKKVNVIDQTTKQMCNDQANLSDQFDDLSSKVGKLQSLNDLKGMMNILNKKLEEMVNHRDEKKEEDLSITMDDENTQILLEMAQTSNALIQTILKAALAAKRSEVVKQEETKEESLDTGEIESENDTKEDTPEEMNENKEDDHE